MTRVLSFHAPYRCRDSGDCCSAGWPIPVEPDRAGRLEQLRAGSNDGAMAFLPLVEDRCVFHDSVRRRCRAQNALGHAALPLACRQFPRVSLIDPRGTSVTLSHYCPTALAMLDESSPIEIVVNASAFPEDGEYEGLDARTDLPPLLRDDMAMDWESWWLWEAQSLAIIDARADEPASALAALTVATDALSGWSPSHGPLDVAIRSAFDQAQQSEAAWFQDDATRQSGLGEVVVAIPPEYGPRSFDRTARPSAQRILSRFLAAHAFANWTAHLGDGLRAWLRSLEVAYTLASDLGVRQADLLLRHLSDPNALAAVWSGRSSDRPSARPV